MLRNIYLYGHLEQRYGRLHRYDIDTPIEAVRALKCHHEDFYSSLKMGSYQIIRSSANLDDSISLASVGVGLGKADAIHIIPVIEGSKGQGTKGIITAVVGLALVATAVVLSGGTMAGLAGTAINLPAGLGSITYGQLALMGGMLALGGIYQAVAPQVQVDKYDRDEQPTSYLFNGAFNRTEQGSCVPVLYGGPFEVGAIAVSASVDDKQIKAGVPDAGYTITVTYGDNGTVTPSGVIPVAPYGGVVLKFYPDSGYLVDSVTVDDVPVDFEQDGYDFFAVTANHTCHVEFAEVSEEDFEIRAYAVGPGTVVPPGRTFVPSGGDLTIEIEPHPGGGVLQYIDVDGTAILPPLTSYTFEDVDADHVLTAYFKFGD